MERRDFIKQTSKAVALAAVTGGTGFLFHNRQRHNYQTLVSKQTGFEVPVDSSLPGITLARNENHLAALNSSLDAIGGIKRFVKPGERVTI